MQPANNGHSHILVIDWKTGEHALRAIREEVFIREQHVPVELEWDEHDHSALHLLAINDHGPVGCARLLPGGHLGRMAVLPEWRKQGIGKKLLLTALDLAYQREWRELLLSAQVQAIPFYEKAGFSVCSPPYLDAGIWHRDMRLALV